MVCFVACGIWCLADVSSVSPASEQMTYQLPPWYVIRSVHFEFGGVQFR